MKIATKAPCRVDLAGGTVDIWPLYLFHPGAVTVNFAINLYTSCQIETVPGSRIVLRSADLGVEESFRSLEELASAGKWKLPLVAHALRFFAPVGGLTVTTHSEAPAGAGISGSSSLSISLSIALNRLTGAGHSLEKIRDIAQNVEAQAIRVPTGCQDYYPALYGGVSAIEMDAGGLRRKAVPVNAADLDCRTVLAYTGEPRNSGINNWNVTKAHVDGDRAVHRNFDRIVSIAMAMRAALEKSDWTEAARLLRLEWANRKKNAPGITTPLIDRLIAVTSRAGARGAKVCGAGGGGCVIFLVEPDAKERVRQLVEAEGATVLPVAVASRGVRVSASAK